MQAVLSVLVILTVIAVLFFGFIEMVGKTLKSNPSGSDSIQTQTQMQSQTQKARDLRLQQKQLMEDRKARMRDMQGR